MIVPDRHSEAPDTEVLLRRVLDLVNSAPKMPLSSTVRLEKDEIVEMLEEAIARLPEEMRQARWLLKERQAEDYVDQKLASFEIVLERIMKTVVQGRQKLRVAPLPEASEGVQIAANAEPDTGEVFFDQDQW